MKKRREKLYLYSLFEEALIVVKLFGDHSGDNHKRKEESECKSII